MSARQLQQRCQTASGPADLRRGGQDHSDGAPTGKPSPSASGVGVWWRGREVDLLLDYKHPGREDGIKVGVLWNDNFLAVAADIIREYNLCGSALATRPTEVLIADCLRARVAECVAEAEQAGRWTRPAPDAAGAPASGHRAPVSQFKTQTDLNADEMTALSAGRVRFDGGKRQREKERIERETKEVMMREMNQLAASGERHVPQPVPAKAPMAGTPESGLKAQMGAGHF